MTDLGGIGKQAVGRHANNRAEKSHLSFRRRERTMHKFRRMKTRQKFASVHANIFNQLATELHLVDRQTLQAAPRSRFRRVADACRLTSQNQRTECA